ncbi:hypothetical protein [uncultured Enterococcus sp.]|uniref:hypothetical protein n=1 Tax=uncultured Enterococcus sp. TaxID=167972 RepID=UPI002AA6D2FE|nr:hypothetical protein [uncultured Enterococcus sp.]
MEKAGKVIKNFVWCHYYPYLFGSGVFLVILPLFVGLENLDIGQSAKVLEYWFSLLGLLLLFPLYLPDNDAAALAIIQSKRTSYRWIVCIRLALEVTFSLLFLGSLLFLMKYNNSSFPGLYFLVRGMGTTLFLGGLSAVTFAVVRHPVPSMMVPFFYYLLNMMSKKEYFGYFDLFSIAQENWLHCLVILGTGSLLLFISILLTGSMTQNDIQLR